MAAPRRTVRLLIKGLLVLLVIAGIAPFALPLNDGRPLFSLSDLKTPSVLEMPEIDVTPDDEEDSAPLIVYRWENEQGNWQFSNERPPEGIDYETINVDPDLSAMDSPDAGSGPALLSAEPGSRPGALADGTGAPPDTPNPYDPGEIRKTLDDARDIQTLLDAHKQRMDEQL